MLARADFKTTRAAAFGSTTSESLARRFCESFSKSSKAFSSTLSAKITRMADAGAVTQEQELDFSR